MEFNKPVSNPMLVGAIELMKAEDTPDHRNMFLNEMMKAFFLAPAIDGKGKAGCGQQGAVSHADHQGRKTVFHGLYRLDGVKKVEGRGKPADLCLKI